MTFQLKGVTTKSLFPEIHVFPAMTLQLKGFLCLS